MARASRIGLSGKAFTFSKPVASILHSEGRGCSSSCLVVSRRVDLGSWSALSPTATANDTSAVAAQPLFGGRDCRLSAGPIPTVLEQT